MAVAARAIAGHRIAIDSDGGLAAVLVAQLRDHGLPLRTARISALRQLVLAVSARVVAGALGFHHTTTTRQQVNAGATWSRYVTGERPDRDPREEHSD